MSAIRNHDPRASTLPAAGRPKMPLSIGARVGDYVVESTIGVGATGTVMAARDLGLDRLVALKALHPGRETSELAREAAAMARVSHANVVAVYAIVDDGPDQILVMEHVAGGSLEDRLQAADPPSPEDVVFWLDGVLRGLGAVHEQGLIHRDLKPANILLGSFGEPKIADFGLLVRGEGGDIECSPAYCAPEAVLGAADHRSMDLYALGVVAFELFTGRLPFEARSPVELLRMHVEEAAPRVKDLRPELVAFDRWVAELLNKDPAQRPNDIRMLRQYLAEALRAHRASDHSTPVVLIAEGDPDRARHLTATLRVLCPDVRVSIAPDGASAADRLDMGGVDLLIASLEAKGLNGVELTSLARACDSPAEVIVTTNTGSTSDWRLLASLGAKALLIWPFDATAFEIAVRRTLQHCARRQDATGTGGRPSSEASVTGAG